LAWYWHTIIVTNNDNEGVKMDFASEYKKNVEAEQIKVICPICKREFMVYPEHLGRAECGNCNVILVIE